MGLVTIKNVTYDNLSENLKNSLDQYDICFKDKTILIKPNLLTADDCNSHTTTHPEFIKAIVEYLENKNAKEIYIGDIPGNQVTTDVFRTAEICGIIEVAGGRFIDISKDLTDIEISSSKLKTIKAAKLALEVDIIINVPKFKTHCRTILTGAIKNIFGLICNEDRQRIHGIASKTKDFAKILVKIYDYFKPHMNIIDAVTCMEGNGPVSGELRTVNKMIISDDGFAADKVIADMMNIPRDKIPTLLYGYKNKDEVNMDSFELDGEIQQIPNFKLPTTIYIQHFMDFDLPLFTGKLAELRLEESICKRCGVCIERCPVNAIKYYSFPVINKEICIGCFCCHELCPEKAWKFERG